MKKINREHYIGLLCILLGIVVLILTSHFPRGAASSMQLTGPAFFPNVLATILIAMGILQIITGFRQAAAQGSLSFKQLLMEFTRPDAVTVLIIIAMQAFFVAFMDVLGFFTSSFVFLFVILARFHITWWKNIVIILAFQLIIYVIFGQIFSIAMPTGLLI